MMDSIKVSECMSRQFVSFSVETPVVEAAIALIKNELMGGPVVDENKKLIGWISEQDCIGVVSQAMYYAERVATVGEVMASDVLTANEEVNAMDVAENMKKTKRKLLPVVDSEHRVLGVVARRHILKAMLDRIAKQISS